MSYTVKDYPSKKAIKDDLKAGITIEVYNPGIGPDLTDYTGDVYLEGPHYPKPHKWYAKAKVINGKVISIQ